MSAVTKRAENPAPAYRRTRVGMVVFGDVTYDSRVRKEAATLANAGYEVLLVCLAADGSRADLPDNVVIRVMPAPRNAITPGLTNPFVATSPAGSPPYAVVPYGCLRTFAGFASGVERP